MPVLALTLLVLCNIKKVLVRPQVTGCMSTNFPYLPSLSFFEISAHQLEEKPPLPFNFWHVVSLTGLWCIHLHLFRSGDGYKDGRPGDLWSTLLPWGHVEPTGFLHRHGRVRTFCSFCFIPCCMSGDSRDCQQWQVLGPHILQSFRIYSTKWSNSQRKVNHNGQTPYS